jgi:hypothetical protein
MNWGEQSLQSRKPTSTADLVSRTRIRYYNKCTRSLVVTINISIQYKANYAKGTRDMVFYGHFEFHYIPCYPCKVCELIKQVCDYETAMRKRQNEYVMQNNARQKSNF